MFDVLMTPEEKAIRDEARAFVTEDVPRQLILDMDAGKVIYPREYLHKAAARRLLGLRFDPAYGGRGLPWTAECAALEEISVLGTSLGCLYSLPSIIGEAIHVFGNEEQKSKYLKPTLEGKLTCAEALTEPRGGSDFFGVTCQARREGDYYVLNGQKRFVVGAEGADYFLVYARTHPTAPNHQAISAFLVDRGPGVDVQHVYGLLGTRGGGTGRIYFRDARVPVANLVGREHGGGDIFWQMMIPERLTSAAGCLGMARSALEIATRYSDRRKAFGQKIRNFEGVSFKVADSLAALDAARALVYVTARTVDAKAEPGRVRRMVSEAKKVATETCWQVVNNAMQIMGGIGYTNIYPIERMLRDARLIMIWTGTSEVMSLLIQHEYYKELGAAPLGRNVEADAEGAELADEKIYE